MPEVDDLSSDEKAMIRNLSAKLTRQDRHNHRRMLDYYLGKQQVSYLGLAVPEDLRGFEFPLNWPRTYVDAIEHRQDVKTLIMPGEEAESEELRDQWDANNLDSEISLYNRDKLIYGQAFMSVSTNEEDPEHPLIRVESPRTMIAKVDARKRRMDACLRLYRHPHKAAADAATLYLPDETLHVSREGSGPWTIDGRDKHKLGRVPIVMGLNRRRTADWFGESEMTDVIKPTDFAARALMNLQLAIETHSVPTKYALGVSKGDFVDPATGKVLDVWQAYFTNLFTTTNKDATFGQFEASDLKNFTEVIAMLAQQVSAVTGLPMRYLGQNPANPAAEGAIRADESRLVKNVERKNRDTGAEIGWALALAHRFSTGEWVDGHRIGVEWHDPGTPTDAQKADSVQKLNGGVPVLSQQGSWDELGWSEKRKDRERKYFRQEEFDLYLKPEVRGDESASAA